MRTTLLNIKAFLDLLRQAVSGTEKKFTSGNINRAIFLLAVPAVLEMTMESLFVCANMFFVSRLGEGAIAVMGATEAVITLAYSVSIGLSISATAIISRRTGEKKFRAAGLSAMQIIYLAAFLSVVISAACFFLYSPVLCLVGLPLHLIVEGEDFIKIMFASIAFVITRISINGIFRGSGDAAIAMRTLWLTNIVNMVLSPLLIFGWGPFPALGLTGAAVAAMTARIAGVAYQAWFLLRGKTIIAIGKAQLMIVPSLLKKVSRLAFAGAIQYLVPASSWVLMIKIVSLFGSHALAGYIIAQRVTSIATMPAWGIGNAAGILTGQNLGAKQAARAEESVWKAGFINMFFLLAVALLWRRFAEPVVGFFTQEPAVLDNAIMYIHYISMAYLLLAFTMVISRSLNAAGNVKLVTLLYILMFYVVQIPLSYLLGIAWQWGPEGIFTAVLLSEIVLAAACILVFRNGKWKEHKV